MADKERYEILKLLGKGRTGGVYEAEDTVLNRKVALRRFFSETGIQDESKLANDFSNIAQNLCNLQNPNLLTIFDAGVDNDGAFMVSQLLDGTSLAEQVAQSCLAEWDAYDLVSQVLDALHAAHAAGFIHGALTPGSIMMLERARGGHLYVILDLGLCRLAPLIQGEDSQLSMMADPALMAPELFDGEAATEKSDLYMLGQLIYTTLAGGHPFAGLSLQEAGEKHKTGDLPHILDYRPELNPGFAAWIHTLICPDPENRPESVQQAAETLPAVEKPTPASSTTGRQKVKLVTGPVATTPASETQGVHALTDRVTVSSSVQNATLPSAQASNKAVRVVLICIGVVLLILAGKVFMTLRGGNTTAAEKQLAKSKPYATFSTSFTTDQKFIPVSDLYNIQDEKTLDWAVLTGIPIRDHLIMHDSGDIIREIGIIGSARPTEYPQPAQAFTSSDDSKLTPSVRLDTEKGGLNAKEGWFVKIKTPNNIEDPLKASIFFTTWKCDVRLRIKREDGTYLKDSSLFKSSKSDIASEITANIYNTSPGETLYLELTLDAYKEGTNPGISMNAVQVFKN